ncbi:MAG: hypothetical protein KKH32_06595 [Bacteroidetes bacterium]|nr:hypothetical protein [Bacteroidota bacterium]
MSREKQRDLPVALPSFAMSGARFNDKAANSAQTSPNRQKQGAYVICKGNVQLSLARNIEFAQSRQPQENESFIVAGGTASFCHTLSGLKEQIEEMGLVFIPKPVRRADLLIALITAFMK